MDHYGSSEFGLAIGNLAAVDHAVKPGSMGRPVPAIAWRSSTTTARGRAGALGHIGMAPSEIGYYSLGYGTIPNARASSFAPTGSRLGDLGRRDPMDISGSRAAPTT